MIREKQFHVKQSNGGAPVVINYAEGPDNGPPLVLLHGITQRWRSFIGMMPVLCSLFHVFAPDLRGHGSSGRVPGGYRGEDYACDVAAFLSERAGAPVLLVGHSLGGMVSVYVAANNPELVRALVLEDTPISVQSIERSLYPALFAGLLSLLGRGLSLNELAKYLGDMQVTVPGQTFSVCLGDLPGNDGAFLRYWARSLQQLDPEALRMSLDGIAAENWNGPALFRRIDCPTLILQANPQLGGLMPSEDVACALTELRDGWHVRLDALGHPMHLQDPTPVLRALQNFLASL